MAQQGMVYWVDSMQPTIYSKIVYELPLVCSHHANQATESLYAGLLELYDADDDEVEVDEAEVGMM
jgi:hypothetical protein